MAKESGLGLENSRHLAEKRLLCHLRIFRQQPHLLAEYDGVMREYFNEHHAEQVPASSPTPENVCYLPHHAVIRRGAVTTKLQVVFEASSHSHDQLSLNDVLEKGTKLDADLLRLLLTFRSHHFILTADI